MILAFDPSLTLFGWSLIDEDKILDCGFVSTKPVIDKLKSISDQLRLLEICKILMPLIKKADIIVSESPYGSKSSSAIKALSLVKGIIIGMCFSANKECNWITAKSAKSAVTNNKETDKQIICDLIMLKYPELDTIFKNRKYNKQQRFAITDSLSVYEAYKK